MSAARRLSRAQLLLVFGLGLLFPTRASAWETRTHQQITEAAWALLKARAQGASFFPGDYPSVQEAQRTVAFFQQLEAHNCRPKQGTNECHTQFVPAKALKEYSAAANELLEPKGKRLILPSGTYTPYLGLLASGNIPTVPIPGQDPKIDYTGTILGYYAGFGDYLEDTYGEVGDKAALRATETTLTIWEVLGVIAACGGCATIGASCVGCAAIVGGVALLEEFVGKYLRDLPYGPSSYLLGHTLTAYWHFQNTYPFNENASGPAYDDIDGFNHGRQKDTHWIKDHVYGWGADAFDIFIRPDMSHGPVNAYQIFTGDDGQQNSSTERTAQSWWRSRDISDTTFMPADNMARAHWENWLKMKRTRGPGGAAEGKTYDLTYLGAALHAIQDATAYHHGVGTLIQGHEDYEQHVGNYFDAAEFIRRFGNFSSIVGYSDSRVILKWSGAKGAETVSKVADGLRLLKDYLDWARGVSPYAASRNDIPIRMLSQHLLYRVQTEHKVLNEIENRGLPLDASLDERSEHGRKAMPWAIAATMVMLVEASNPAIDTSGVGTMPMSMFNQHELDTDGDGVPDNRDFCPHSNQTGTSAVDAKGCPENTGVGKKTFASGQGYRTCVEAAMPTLEQLISGAVSQEDYMSAFFWAKAECETGVLGDDNGSVEERFQAAQQRWNLYQNFLQSRDRLAFAKERACLRFQYPDVFPHADRIRDEALCSCTADRDGDGVSDCDDECDNTPSRTTVDAKGCAQ